MQFAAPIEDETIAALDQLKRSVRMAFCGVMQSTRLPPLAALSLAATAVGLLYLEVADAHCGDHACPAAGSRAAQRISRRCIFRLRLRRSSSPAPTSARFRFWAAPEDRPARGGRADAYHLSDVRFKPRGGVGAHETRGDEG